MPLFLRKLLVDDSGLETVEYAMLLGLIVIALLGAIAAVGGWVAGVFSSVQTAVGI